MSTRSTSNRRKLFRRLFGTPAARTRRRGRPSVCPLEGRQLLTITLTPPSPSWVEQEAGPIYGSQNVNVDSSPVANPSGGAANSIAVDPNVKGHVLLGTVTGGVWQSWNVDPLNPGAVHWTPLTDQMPSLAIGAVAIDPLDSQVLYAGTGNFSSDAGKGDPAVGLYRSADGGVTWGVYGSEFVDANNRPVRVKKILPTGLGGSPDKEVVLVATVDSGDQIDTPVHGGGLFRSTDGGRTFTHISATDPSLGLPDGYVVSDLVVDPNDSTHFYATVPGIGVYESRNDPQLGPGAVWKPLLTLNIVAQPFLLDSREIEMTAHKGPQTELFVGVSVPNPNGPTGFAGKVHLYHTADGGLHWGELATAPDSLNAELFYSQMFSLVADPKLPGVVYASGQGLDNVYRFDSGRWSLIVGKAAVGQTFPHSDSRDLAFLDDSTLMNANDGGVYMLRNPNPVDSVINPQPWHSLIGNLDALEFHHVAYDTNHQRVFGGAQDVGTATANLNPIHPGWKLNFIGDGGYVAYDPVRDYRYSLSDAMHNFNYIDPSDNVTQLFLGKGAPFGDYSGLNGADAAAVDGIELNPMVLDVVDPSRMLIGRTGLYASQAIGNSPAGAVVSDITANLSNMARVSALAYGGYRLTAGGTLSGQANVAFVGTYTGQLFYRGESGSSFTLAQKFGPDAAGHGRSVVSIALDPQDWRRAYVVLSDDTVWVSNDVTNIANNPFQDLTANLPTLASDLQSITLFDNTPGKAGDAIPLVGGQGGVYRLVGGSWSKYGLNLPSTLVTDVVYVPQFDRLVAGTYGRGAWTLGNVAASIGSLSDLEVDSDVVNGSEVIRLVRDASLSGLLHVYVNSEVPTFTVPIAGLNHITINGLKGKDTIVLDDTNGDVVPAGGVEIKDLDFNDQVQIIGAPNSHVFRADPGKVTIDGDAGVTFGVVASVDVFAGKADNHDAHMFDIRGTNASRLALHGAAGDDAFFVDSDGPATPQGSVKLVRGELDIDGGGGAGDTLLLNDVSDPVASQVTVTQDSVGANLANGDTFFGPGGNLRYMGLSGLTILMGTDQRARDSGNNVEVENTAPGTKTLIRTGGGDDLIRVFAAIASRTGTGGVQSPLTIDGQGGIDTLDAFDTAATLPARATLTDSTLGAGAGDTFFSPGGTLTYSSIAAFNVFMGIGGDTVNIRSTNAGTMTTVHTGIGADSVVVGSDAPALDGDLSHIAGPLSVDVGNDAGNKLLLNDRAAKAGNQGVVINGGQVLGLAGPADNVPVNFAGQLDLTVDGSDSPTLSETYIVVNPAARLFLRGNSGDDKVLVPAVKQLVGIDAGPGHDTVVVGFGVHSLGGILAPVFVSGGLGEDDLLLDDQAAPAGQVYTLMANSAQRAGTGPVVFDNSVDHLVVRTAGGNGFGQVNVGQVNVGQLPVAQVVDVLGDSANDRLRGPDQANQWQLIGANAGVLDGRLNFLGFENLTGGAAKDTFVVHPSASLSGKLDGGGGTDDTLDYSAWTAPVTFDLTVPKATALGQIGGILWFVGGQGSDTLQAPNQPNVWLVNGGNSGQVSTLNLGVVRFASVENLRGGTSADAYLMAPAGHLAGSVFDPGGENRLDYSSRALAVSVDLSAGSATSIDGGIHGVEDVTGGGGNDVLIGDDQDNILRGGGGNDFLSGRGGDDILLGGDGADRLLGDDGNDILIGGTGSDMLFGGAGSDLCIGGSTAFDGSDAALSLIRAEWTRTDLPGTPLQTYNLRVDHLKGIVAGGKNGPILLKAGTVLDDAVPDLIAGGADLDWFLADLVGAAADTIADQDKSQERSN
jgi:hypothetical protein